MSEVPPSEVAREPVPAATQSPSASRAVLGRGSYYTVATAGPALAALAVIPVVTRLLPVAEYDLVAVATVVVQVASILVALGLGAAITRQYILAADGAPGARGVVVVGGFLAVLVSGLLAVTGPLWAPAVLGRPFGVELALALLSGAGGACVILAQAYLRGADRPGTFILLAAVASLAGPAAGLVGVVVLGPEASVYLSGVAAGFVVAGVWGVALVARSGPVVVSRRGIAASLRIGTPTVPHQVSLYLALAGLVVVADRLLGDGGRANVALTIGAGATVVTAGLNNAWAPVVYRAAEQDRRRILDETTRVIALIAVVLAGGVALLAPWLVRVAAPGSYDHAGLVPAVAVSSAAALPSVVYLASGHLVFASGRTGWLALTTPLAVAVGLGAASGLASWTGLAGIAAGYLVAYLLLALATTMVQRQVASTPWSPRLAPGTVVLWIVVGAAGAALPTAGGWSWLRVVCAIVLGVTGVLASRRLLVSRGLTV